VFIVVLGFGEIVRAAAPSTPTFFARRDYIGIPTRAIAIADANGDGIPDLITTNDDIFVLLGNGDGTFRSGPSSSSGMLYTDGVAAVDLNGDGKVDLVFAGGLYGGNPPQGIGVCMGNGDGTFEEAVFYQAGNDTGFGNLVVGDFNGDGIPDVAASGTSGVWLFIGKGNGAFNVGVLAIPLLAVYGGALAAADFNGDHNLDLVMTLPSSDSGFDVFLGNGNGTFKAPQTFAEPRQIVGLAVGALTKGGRLGIAVSGYASSYVYLYPGNGDGGFDAPQQIFLPGTAGTGGLAIGDLRGDGYPISFRPKATSSSVRQPERPNLFTTPFRTLTEASVSSWPVLRRTGASILLPMRQKARRFC